MLLLQRDPLRLVHPHDLVQLAGEDVVVALLDDHGSSIPPMQRYLISSHSSIPYFEPSRPMPDSLTPPNGAISVEMKPVLMPTIPYSSAFGDAPDAAEVAAVEVRGEPVRRVVRLRDRLGLGREARDAGDRPERLLGRHRGVARDAGDHRRPVEEPAEALAAGQELAAALERVGDVALDLLDRLLLDQRADLGRRIEARADGERARPPSTSRCTNSS